MLEVLFENKSVILSFRQKTLKIKKYFNKDKAQKEEVINTKSGHQKRASVTSFHVMLEPVCFIFLIIALCSNRHYGIVAALLTEAVHAGAATHLLEVLSICINVHDPFLQLTALTEEALFRRK